MASQEKNICNALRESWRSLITLVDYLEGFLRKILSQIQALINRIKNTVLRRILSTIRSLQEIISNFLGLQAIDTAEMRTSICGIIYKCQPMIEILSQLISKDFFDKIFGPDSIKTIDLSKYGIAQLTFNSKFELFEYVACRLSLSGLLNSIVDNLISNLLQFLGQFDKYLDINWWLQNTVWGRALARLMKEYEDFFNDRVKPFLDKLIPYLNCTFALCDFSISTNNYFEDFQQKFKAERQQKVDLSYEFVILKSDLYSDLTESFDSAKTELDTFKSTLVAPIEASKPLFHPRNTGENIGSDKTAEKTQYDSQTLPYNIDEKDKIKNDVQNRKSSLVPSTRNEFASLRRTIVEYSPNSKD